ncbi:MAG: hypothetical protein MUO67_13790 [Anaerolineales bacterium]|nr:hypothetical protein [Anaerolineales bacterium]
MVEAARGDGNSTPIQLWGLSYHPCRFVVSSMATHPQGRERVKQQVDFCPTHAPLRTWAASCLTHPPGRMCLRNLTVLISR